MLGRTTLERFTRPNARTDGGDYRCRRENSRPEPVFRYFSKALAFAFDLNAIAVSMRHGRHLAVYTYALIALF